jgi:hypothetical protein
MLRRSRLIPLVGMTVLIACLFFGAVPMLAGASDPHSGLERISFDLAPSSPAIANCFPHLQAHVEVKLQTDKVGFDSFNIEAAGLPAGTSFTVFLLEQPGSPFGAAEYIGDFTTGPNGKGQNSINLIVAEAFASTLVNGQRVRADLNHVGFWFADPAGDDVCFGPGGGAVTPFDGDNEAGVQVMNSANALPGAPLPPP